jgi:hypothetical protein
LFFSIFYYTTKSLKEWFIHLPAQFPFVYFDLLFATVIKTLFCSLLFLCISASALLRKMISIITLAIYASQPTKAGKNVAYVAGAAFILPARLL